MLLLPKSFVEAELAIDAGGVVKYIARENLT